MFILPQCLLFRNLQKEFHRVYENDHFYVDLVFYHSVLNCHILIDLKLGKLTHGDVGLPLYTFYYSL